MSFLGALGIICKAYEGIKIAYSVADFFAEIPEMNRVRKELEKNAKDADDYIQKWILLNEMEVTLFRPPEGGLKVSVKKGPGKEVRVAHLLEPQARQVMEQCIERVKERCPRVIEACFKVDFRAPPFVPIKTWKLPMGKVSGPDPNTGNRKNYAIGTGKLSLIDGGGGRLFWKFFATQSRIVSFLEVSGNTYAFLPEGGYKIIYDVKELQYYEMDRVGANSEKDHSEIKKKGAVEFCHYRATRIEEVFLSAKRYPSKIDPSKSISRHAWSVTLISMQPENDFPHAQLLFEKITKEGRFFQIAHITANKGGSYSKQGFPELLQEMTFEGLKRWKYQSPTWVLPAEKISNLMRKIQAEKYIPVTFHFTGNTSIFGDKDCHNCVSWAKEQLKFVNIHLPDRIRDYFCMHPNQFAK